MRNLILAVALLAAHPAAAHSALIGLPPAPELSPAGYQLILDYEVGGGRAYFERYLARPTWPGAASGVTIGVGYDLGYNSPQTIADDWHALPDDHLDRLLVTAGLKGPVAKQVIPKVRDILIRWDMAEGVFNNVTLARFYALTSRTFPGLESLHPNAQAALVSLVFNRGSSLAGPSRVEMRRIRDLVSRRDYREIAAQIRAMNRLWAGKGLDGLLKRREAEARLVESN